ncbi:hypothetical protein K504DRAFT_87163 [Pleomassaria siparia CBS 279.74]|uniref:Uncharacterized protein n=1 Tax=Pleomassaria siparia CBS 279.74 TaxID=1314801 RepID=A0A6G1JZB6_9PLEO|nr:hypothetical protein K504DRAFT_87163 [Pleomassaria siparia CBS 279.74]
MHCDAFVMRSWLMDRWRWVITVWCNDGLTLPDESKPGRNWDGCQMAAKTRHAISALRMTCRIPAPLSPAVQCSAVHRQRRETGRERERERERERDVSTVRTN